MSTKSLFISLLAIIGGWTAPAKAASIALDSFNEGAFALSDLGPDNVEQMISSPLIDRRRGSITDTGEAYASLSPPSGTLNYTVALRGSPPQSYGIFFNLNYSNSDGSNFSLLGFDSIVVNISGLVGAGEFRAFRNSSPNTSILVPITATGDLVYPLSNISGGMDLDSYGTLSFQFFPRSNDFSITLDEITLVPEPSAILLLGWGGIWMMRRRRQ